MDRSARVRATTQPQSMSARIRATTQPQRPAWRRLVPNVRPPLRCAVQQLARIHQRLQHTPLRMPVVIKLRALEVARLVVPAFPVVIADCRGVGVGVVRKAEELCALAHRQGERDAEHACGWTDRFCARAAQSTLQVHHARREHRADEQRRARRRERAHSQRSRLARAEPRV
eukprot:CAMPEP_0119390092 /NCGR_PEP_ID=MMETSP1334-20130426/111892_1 /TAXON_ID=127549 /ORGANISM="Calcidiscus leptoporus, Strain RCC1130" /LENGTH=171 /DNA_ID=CAMNT_0007412489 /DNA_START=300 /DNA_END=811 /DNA_ORIENTATION=-